MILKVQDSAVT